MFEFYKQKIIIVRYFNNVYCSTYLFSLFLFSILILTTTKIEKTTLMYSRYQETCWGGNIGCKLTEQLKHSEWYALRFASTQLSVGSMKFLHSWHSFFWMSTIIGILNFNNERKHTKSILSNSNLRLQCKSYAKLKTWKDNITYYIWIFFLSLCWFNML